MRVVLDTNVVVSGLLWSNTPRRLLDAVRDGRLTAFTSQALLMELADVLSRDHLAVLIAQCASSAAELTFGYSKLTRVIEVPAVVRAVPADPDDDHVLACAVAAQADFVVTGDKKHLLPMRSYRGIEIVPPSEAIARIAR